MAAKDSARGAEQTRSGSGGSNEIEIDREEFEKLAAMQCTMEEIASWFRCSVRTIQRHLKRYPELKELLEHGKNHGRIAIRRQQFQIMNRGDRTMSIFLGKVYLNQNDRPQPFDPDQDTPVGTVKFDVKPAKSDVKVTNAAK